MSDVVDVVERALSSDTYAEFDERVRRQADFLRETLDAGRLDNEEFTVGLEIEVYAVSEATRPDGGDGARSRSTHGPRLARFPESVFESSVTKELGLHNAEVNTEPTAFDEAGLDAQAAAIERRLVEAREVAGEGVDVALDAMWVTPPPEGSYAYLAATRERDGVVLADNMRQAPRYVALDNEALRLAGGELDFSVAGYEASFPSIMLESLATSIQPHLQIPDVEQVPRYHNVATRTMAPVLALTSNSPFLPGDCYDVADPERLVADTAHELRIAAFEQSMNQTEQPKVRVPEDVETPTDVVDSVVADPDFAPFLEEWVRDSPAEPDFTDRYWEYTHKRSSHWRWVRCVVGGDAVAGAADERSMRVEYRPLPTQPTVRDLVGVLALTAGLLRGLVAADHPLATLEWERAREGFYDVVDDGLDADIPWVTADGAYTTDDEEIFDEVFHYAREGLARQGVSASGIDRYLDPIEARWDARTAPSGWKKSRVRDALDDGADLETAVTAMQREYLRLSRETDTFAEWL
ncbi:MAG: hypothetical protein ABEI96_05515 [Haloarculaceae archaeon]